MHSDHPQASAERWQERNWRLVFEPMLADWYVDESLWPRSRSRKLFSEWCAVQPHTTLYDV